MRKWLVYCLTEFADNLASTVLLMCTVKQLCEQRPSGGSKQCLLKHRAATNRVHRRPLLLHVSKIARCR